ncbi:MAG: serine/threonine protein kinase [Deltaproteobacteria bacterium]|nr:serine/threonine protein kinase [Deltaproteobacteria bacterium]
MSDDPLLGRTLAGRYRLIARLGTGGMSSVYLARHVLIERLSAIKVLDESLLDEEVPPSGTETRESPYREHFLREARAVNRINHANIVEISDYGEATVTLEGGARRQVVYLVMEYVPGESLQKLMARGPIPAARLLPIASQVTAALARAHQTGVIHRDIKPENILLVARKGGGDLVKLTDFGVAKVTQLGKGGGVDQVLGTPGYIAPEYLVGETSIDGRADLYSLGVVLYEAITGALPFGGRDEAELLTRPLVEDPLPISQVVRGVPPAVEELIMRCLRRRPDERPHDAFLLLDELERVAAALGVSMGATPRRETTSGMHAAADVETIDDEPPPSRFLPSIVPPPRLGTITPASLAQAWRAHWDALGLRARRKGQLPFEVEDAIQRAAILVQSLVRAATIVGATQRALDQLEAEARGFRATLGNAIDVLAHDLSKAHQRVIDLTSLRARLYLERRHLTEPALIEAKLWEVAAADDELRNARAIREDLGHQIGALQDSLFQRNNAHEAEVQRTIAALEGESAAIATLHRELELGSAQVGRAIGASADEAAGKVS